MEKILARKVVEAVKSLYNVDIEENLVQISATRKDFTGDYTLVVFPLLRFSKKSPELTAEDIGGYLKESCEDVHEYNVIKGFLNIVITSSWWYSFFNEMASQTDIFAKAVAANPETVMVEYSSPNTNKPLHLGHIRNNLLGYSLCKILEACGHKVVKTNIVNDRGIHICKSMLAWQKKGNGETPASSGLKGDHLVGKYYVIFEQELKLQAAELQKNGLSEAEARNEAPLMKEAREMLLKWEAGDPETIELWKTMNSWVYAGFNETYKLLGVEFDKIYYESETYMIGKDIVLDALKNNVLYRKDDGSIWVDLSGEGLDNKLLLRSDGTAVYMTQDLGTAVLRHQEYGFDKCVYVVGNEQNYHFQVLKSVLHKIGYPWSAGLHHFSYGMVELPEGKMKSREGTVVDADDLIAEMKESAKTVSLELGKLADFSGEEKEELFRKLGLGALKYFILKVDPKKNMLFNPAESIDFNGNTGPFIQYTYARIKSVFRKAETDGISLDIELPSVLDISDKEISLVKLLGRFPATVNEASETLSPALVANYCYDLAKEYNQFYHDITILGEPDMNLRAFRLKLSGYTASVLKAGVGLMGMEMPERM
jgi:arginyl-tRNA synthetase